MKRILILLTSLLVVGNVYALPQCPLNDYRGPCYGAYIEANGFGYIGEFKDDERHGKGILALPDGFQFIGEWKDDKPWEGVACPDYHFRRMSGTFSNGQWCPFCVPTEQQLTTVAEIDQNLRSISTAVYVQISICNVNDKVLRGRSFSNPIVVESVAMEYMYLERRFGNFDPQLITQGAVSKDGRSFDVFEIEIDGNVIEIYFDISSFY